jgi:hypothetical protein
MATFDAHANLAKSTVATAPSPALTGTSLTVAAGQAVRFPVAPFNCTVWPTGVDPTFTNAEIVRVTAIAGDVFTIVRAQEGTTARAIVVGDNIANTATVKVFTDIQTAVNAIPTGPWTPWTPVYSTDLGDAAFSFTGVTTLGARFQLMGHTLFVNLFFDATLNAITPSLIYATPPPGVAGGVLVSTPTPAVAGITSYEYGFMQFYVPGSPGVFAFRRGNGAAFPANSPIFAGIEGCFEAALTSDLTAGTLPTIPEP